VFSDRYDLAIRRSVVFLVGDDAFLIGGAAFPVGDDAFLIGGAAFPAGDDAFLIGGAAFPVGDDAFLIGGAAFPVGDDAFLIGGAAFPVGDDAFLIGGAAFPVGRASFLIEEASLPQNGRGERVEKASARLLSMTLIGKRATRAREKEPPCDSLRSLRAHTAGSRGLRFASRPDSLDKPDKERAKAALSGGGTHDALETGATAREGAKE